MTPTQTIALAIAILVADKLADWLLARKRGVAKPSAPFVIVAATKFVMPPPIDKTRAPGSGRAPFIGFRIQDALLAGVDELAERRGVNRSEVVREALAAYLDSEVVDAEIVAEEAISA